jgi:uncharacterized membrane protein
LEGRIIELFIVALLAGILIPVGFNQIFGANETTWDANTKTVFNLIPIIVAVSIIILVITYIRGKR